MKKALSLFLAASMLVFVLLLAACGGGKEPENTTTGTNPQTTESTAGTSDTEKTDGETVDSDKTTASTSDAAGTTVPGGSTELTGKEKHPDFMDVNFGGKTFNFAVSKGWSGGWDCYEIYAEATGSDDLITEAIINRNAVVENLYNCKIRDTKTDSTEALSTTILLWVQAITIFSCGFFTAFVNPA